MRKNVKFYRSINTRVLIIMLSLFFITAMFVGLADDVRLDIAFLTFVIVLIIVLFVLMNKFITKPLGELISTAQKLAEGDVYTSVSYETLKQKSEIGLLANAINDMSSVYQSMLQSTANLFDAANIGRLNVRNDASNYKGDIQKVINQINETLDATTMYLNSSPEGILIMSKDFEMYFQNEQYAKYFGNMPARELIEKMFPGSREDGLSEAFAKAINREGNISAKIRLNNLCFSIVCKEININKESGGSVLVIITDVTDLMREKENAQSAARAKSNFLSSISHEIRTPMNAIIGMTKIAESTEDVSKLKYCLQKIAASSEHLLSIINDVLDMSKIESGKFELENASLSIERMLTRASGIVVDGMSAKNQKFDVIIGEDIQHNFYIGDELRLSQVITNLLSNAVKFTPENGEITLKANEVSGGTDAAVLRFSVSDTGIGIKKEQIGKLFASFEQIDGSITRQFGGTGLGLAISKDIIERMGGRIWAESEYGKGSDFIFEVKLARATRRELTGPDGIDAPDMREGLPDFTGVNILLAEDIEINREIFAELLAETNISIDFSENGTGAVAKFKENPGKYDLIIMDVEMPEMDGYEATKRIRAMDGVDGAKSIPIIAMTANVFREDIERCLACGMNDHLPKPIDEKLVAAKISKYIADRRLK